MPFKYSQQSMQSRVWLGNEFEFQDVLIIAKIIQSTFEPHLIQQTLGLFFDTI